MKSFLKRQSLKCVILLLGALPASAELPALGDGQWLGYFAVARERSYQFTVAATDLAIVLQPVNKDGDVLAGVPVTLDLGILQALPDGTSMFHALRRDTLETSSPATADLQRTSFRCKAAGDAVIEVSMEKAKGALIIESCIVDPGTLPKECLKPLILLNTPPMYGVEIQEKSEWTRGQIKEFEQRISKDKIRLKWLDGVSKSLKPSEKLDADIRKAFGAGLVSAEIEFSKWQGRVLQVATDGGCSLSMAMAGPSFLNEGFEIRCAPDSLNNPKNTARFRILMK